jgi:hypothetical protein
VKNQKNKQQQTTTTMKSWRKRQDGEQTQDATLWDAAEGLTEAKSDSGLVLVSSRSFLFRGGDSRLHLRQSAIGSGATNPVRFTTY